MTYPTGTELKWLNKFLKPDVKVEIEPTHEHAVKLTLGEDVLELYPSGDDMAYLNITLNGKAARK